MTDRVAVVTGAARGIGLATSKILVDRGTSVVMVDRDAEALKLATKEIDGNVLPLTLDVSVAGEVDQICLLYTSPSPRDATLSRMPSSA